MDTSFTTYEDFPPIDSTSKPSPDYVYTHDPKRSKIIFGHEVAIVGRDDTKNAWLVRNSWGAQWNGDGYIWMTSGIAGIADPNRNTGEAAGVKLTYACGKPFRKV